MAIFLDSGNLNHIEPFHRMRISRLHKLLYQFDFQAQIIAGTTSERFYSAEWLEAKAHVITVTQALMKGMIVYSYYKKMVQMILRDGEKMVKVIQ